MEVKYNAPIEVTEKQYALARRELSGICAFRTEKTLFMLGGLNTRFFIKLMMPAYKNNVIHVLGLVN